MSGDLERITSTERAELAGIVKRNFRVARSGIDHRKAELLADFEDALAKKWSPYDQAWREAMAAAQVAVDEANAVIAETFASFDAPQEFAPEVGMAWQSRGENESASRRAELRKVAQSRAEAEARRAKLELDKAEAAQLTTLAKTAIRTPEALGFLGQVPTLDELMPGLALVEVEAGITDISKRW